jgi:hypothetical protein
MMLRSPYKLPQAGPTFPLMSAGVMPGQMPAGLFGSLPGVGAMSPDGLAVPSRRPPGPITMDAGSGEQLPLPAMALPTFSSDNMSLAKPKFFDRGGLGSHLLQGLADAAMYYSASTGNPAAMATLRAKQEERVAQRQRQQQLEDRDAGWKHDADVRAAQLADPQYFTAGNDRVRYDPATGQATTLYRGQTDAQQYAASLGLTPDSVGYTDALKDFTLRGYGPTAMDGRMGLEDARQDDRLALEGARQGNRTALRSMPTYAQTHPASSRAPTGMAFAPRTVGNVIAPIMSKVAAGKPLSAGEQQVYDQYQRRRGGGAVGGGYSVTPGGGAPRVPGTAATPAVITRPGDEKYLPKGTHFRVPDGRVLIR